MRHPFLRRYVIVRYREGDPRIIEHRIFPNMLDDIDEIIELEKNVGNSGALQSAPRWVPGLLRVEEVW